MFIDGVKTVIQTEPEIEIVGQALNGEEVLSFLENNNVDIHIHTIVNTAAAPANTNNLQDTNINMNLSIFFFLSQILFNN